jgi:hypothetical protein
MNNLHADLPPLMSDGRNFTNWQPGTLINETIRKKERLTTDREYRAYLQNNAESIMEYNRTVARSRVSNYPASSYDTLNGTPFLYKTGKERAPRPESSDLKTWFLTKFGW